MPKKIMISNKKALMVEAIERIIIMIILVFIVWKIGEKVAYAAFGGTDAQQSFEELVKKINSNVLKQGSDQVLLHLDTNTAVIGFSKNNDFKCKCDAQRVTAQFKRPNNNECKESACVCFCQNLKAEFKENFREITCEKLQCRKLKSEMDIYSPIHLGEFTEKVIVDRGFTRDIKRVAQWEGGFLYYRHTTSNPDTFPDSFLVTGLPLSSDRTRTLYLENKNINGINYVALCPKLPCFQQPENQLNNP